MKTLRALALAAPLLGACQQSVPEVAARMDCSVGTAPPGTRVLVFSRTTGYRHESIPVGAKAIGKLAETHAFVVEHTEDATVFTDQNLPRYSAVMFLNTTGDVLDAPQEAAFERYIRSGGGFVGVHAASDTEYSWAWYGKLVGAYFASHPAIQQGVVRIEDSTHVSTRCVPSVWTRTDEWYDFRAVPPPGVTVLASLDESTYHGGKMGQRHPIAWYHRFDGGRAWYTGMGHTAESYSEPAFLAHLAGGIIWAATR